MRTYSDWRIACDDGYLSLPVTAMNSVWGAFNIKREDIRYGIRLSLPHCPHALAWTIIFNERNQGAIIHCTIDKTEQAPDFVESIHDFVEDWSDGVAEDLQ